MLRKPQKTHCGNTGRNGTQKTAFMQRSMSHAEGLSRNSDGRKAALLRSSRRIWGAGKRALRHGNVHNRLFRHGKRHSQHMEKLKCSFPTSCKQSYPQFHKTASYTHSHNADYYGTPLILSLIFPYQQIYRKPVLVVMFFEICKTL